MKLKLYNYFNFICLLFILFYFFAFRSKYLSFKLFYLIPILFVVFISLIFNKYSARRYKYYYLILGVIIFFTNFVSIFLLGYSIVISLLVSLLLLFTFVVTCLVYRWNFNGNISSITRLFILFACVPFACEKISCLNILICLLPISLYLLLGFDYSSFYRKKNLLRLFIFYMIIGISSFVNPLLVIIELFPMINLLERYDSNIKKIIAFLGVLIMCVSGWVLSNIISFDISINLSFIFPLFIIVLTNLLNILINNEARYKIRYFLAFTNILAIYSLVFSDYTAMYISIPVIFIVLTFAIDNLGILSVYFSFDRYKFPKDIKKVSAVVPNYNYANYLEMRIDSILNQKYPIYELIILDDCSKDNSIEVINKKIEKIRIKYPELIVKFIPNKHNSGNVFKQWQKAFDSVTGDYLWICEADDLCNKHFLNTVMQGFDNPKVVLSYCESTAIDEYGSRFKSDLRDWIDIYNCGKWNANYINNGKKELSETLCINNTIPNASGVVFKIDKKIPVKEYLKKSQEFVLCGDWYFYSKYLLHGSISYNLNSLNYHRMHKNGVTLSTDNFVHYNEIVSVQESIANDVNINSKVKKLINYRLTDLRKNMCISDDELKYHAVELKKLLKDKKINDEVLLSVIIPVYNVEKYLRKCLKSIFIDLPIKTEVIIINDGSPDNSEEIIKEFMLKHKEIRYIKKPNGGLSSVKNVGLREAKGKYVIFLDSDDYVSSNMYSTMLKKIICEDADIVYSDVLMVYEDNSVKYVSMKNFKWDNQLMQILDGNLMAASWNKMVKRELYNGLTFPEGINNEDVAVSPLLFLRAKKIVHIQSPFYKYLQRTGSIQNSGFNEKRFVVFDTAKICFERIKNYPVVERKMVEGAIITNQLLALLIWPIADIKDSTERKKLITLFCKKINDLNIDVSNQYIIDYLREYSKESLLNHILNCNVEKIDKIIKR